MSCVSPLKAYWRSVDRAAITFDVNHSATKVPFNLPCGRCIGCRMDKANQWGLRCVHESKMWDCNSYVTLTYADEFMPPGGTVCLRDVQLFMKRLRKARNATACNPVRFFLGAEYGELNRRPHYHALLFNCGFPDMVKYGENKRGENLYTSAELSRLWPHGFNTIGEVTLESGVYCAKYALKKLNVGEHSTPEARAAFEARYVVYDADGIIYQRAPEFAVMSRRPGIGAGYMVKYGHEVAAHDSIVIDGREVKPPRYYDTYMEENYPKEYARAKARRKREGVLAKPDNTPERLRVKRVLMEKAAEKKERKL